MLNLLRLSCVLSVYFEWAQETRSCKINCCILGGWFLWQCSFHEIAWTQHAAVLLETLVIAEARLSPQPAQRVSIQLGMPPIIEPERPPTLRTAGNACGCHAHAHLATFQGKSSLPPFLARRHFSGGEEGGVYFFEPPCSKIFIPPPL